MKSIITLTLCIAAMISYGQRVKIQTVSTYIVESDTCDAYLVCHSRLSTLCMKVSTIHNILGNDVFVELCYAGSQITTICPNKDTLCLGSLASGSYNIIVRVAERYDVSCDTALGSDTAYTTLQIGPVGITDAINSKLQLYPNPAENRLHCSITANSMSGTYAIHNLHGAMVSNSTAIHQPNFDIDISQLPSGIYYLAVQDDKQRYVKKFIKQ